MVPEYTDDENEIVKYYDAASNWHQWSFMNDGYVDLDQYGFPITSNGLELSDKYRPWQYQAQLYKKCLDCAGIATDASLGTLLDLSCGKGGGISFIKDHYQFEKLVGVDLNPSHIEVCRSSVPDVHFLAASATSVPLQDDSIDVITTVEAVGYYDPIDSYLKEVHRLLRPGGVLVQAGAIPTDGEKITSQQFSMVIDYYRHFGLELRSSHDITKNVRTACAISKYVLLDLDPSGSYFRCLLSDEEEFINNIRDYFVLVFAKDI